MRAKFVNENIGFKRGVDPKKSLNLGGYSFETLREGTILRSKKSFGLTNTGNFQSYDGATNRYTWGTYFLITNLTRLDNYYIHFRFISISTLAWMYRDNPEEKELKEKEGLEMIREKRDLFLREGIEGFPEYERKRMKFIDKVGKQKFNNLFKILEAPH
jgi:hypothetical protein